MRYGRKRGRVGGKGVLEITENYGRERVLPQHVGAAGNDGCLLPVQGLEISILDITSSSDLGRCLTWRHDPTDSLTAVVV